MLGFAPIAAAPLGAAGDGGVNYDASFGDALVITDSGIVARQVFATAVDEASLGAISVAVTASTFNAAVSFEAEVAGTSSAAAAFAPNISEAAESAVTTAAIAGFLGRISEIGLATDSALVEASVFSATVADAADAIDTLQPSTVMASFLSEGADIDDSSSAKYLWNIINNAQSTNWTVVKTQN